MDKKWFPIKGYEGLYEINKCGEIKSLGKKYTQKCGSKLIQKESPKKIISQSYTVEGYLVCSLTKDGKTKQYKVHRLIAEAFIPNPENKDCINHINGIKDDNRIINLEWCTPKENTIHAHNSGLCGRNKKSKYVAETNSEGIFVSVYESALQAAKAEGHYSSASNLHKVCRNGKGTWNGKHWKYISEKEYNNFLSNI